MKNWNTLIMMKGATKSWSQKYHGLLQRLGRAINRQFNVTDLNALTDEVLVHDLNDECGGLMTELAAHWEAGNA